MTEPLTVPLAHGAATALPPLDALVEPLRIVAASAFPSGHKTTKTPAFGTLRFVKDGDATEVDFTQDRAFEVWGHQMTVSGDGADTLVIHP